MTTLTAKTSRQGLTTRLAGNDEGLFKPFSTRQLKVLTWWTPDSPFKDYNGIIADGSIRSGKTLSMSLSFVIWAMATFNGQNFAICGKTVGSLHRNVIRGLLPMLTALGYDVHFRRTDGMIVITREGVQNYFYCFGGRDESSQDLIQGMTLAGILFDEVALMPESFVNQGTGRCSVAGSKFWFNCNPGGRLHWFKVKWINRYRQSRLMYLHFTMEDNLSLSEDVKARYRSMYTGVFYRRYIEGLWCAAEGIIYDCFDHELNSFTWQQGDPLPFLPGRSRHYVGIDYGTTNPTVFLDAWDDGDTFWIMQEYYHDSRALQRQKTATEYAEDLDKFLQGDHSARIIVDPSAEAFKLELRNKGYRLINADNEVLEGIRFTAAMLRSRRIKIERSCTNIRREFDSYVWDEKAAQQGTERPVKENDHAMDALRYIIKTTVNRRRLAQ